MTIIIINFKVKVSDIVYDADSISACLSKGLGAPAGSLLVGPYSFIKRARRVRKSLGGGMRQVGILAAAGLVALDDFERGMLRSDHSRAKALGEAIEKIPGFKVFFLEAFLFFIIIHIYDYLYYIMIIDNY